jgi:pyruvate dehydrogenase E1 component alpha subunit
MAFFGDGATGTGIFHEAVNLAAVLKLPVVFLCENNQYAVSTSVQYSSPVPTLSDRAIGYGIPSVSVNGNDVIAVYEAVKQAVERARSGEGPSFVEGVNYRWEGHYKGDPEMYRSKEEVSRWREEKDPLVLFRNRLLDENIASEEEIESIDTNIERAVEESVKYSMESPEPSMDSLFENLYAE